jgi:hypothetical protein
VKAPAALLLTALAGCTAAAAPAGEPPIPERGTGRTCDGAKAQALLGRKRSEAVGAEAMRLSGGRALRWIPIGTMVTMEYRPDRLNLHLGPSGEVVKIDCG